MAAILLTDDTMSNPSTDYLLAGRAPELERRQLQSIVWEPAARELPTKLSPGTGLRAIDLGCGVMGWLRVLSAWVGDGGHVTGTDVDERMLAGAKDLVEREQLSNVSLVKDDLFDSQLPPHTVDLVHSRFQIAPLGVPSSNSPPTHVFSSPAGYSWSKTPIWRLGESKAWGTTFTLIQVYATVT